MDIGQLIDNLYAKRAERLELDKRVTGMKAEETELKAQIIELLTNDGLVGAKGHVATVSIKPTVQPKILDWSAVHEWVITNNMPELLQRRITVSFWEALRQDGTLVPGTEVVVVTDLSLTKSTRS